MSATAAADADAPAEQMPSKAAASGGAAIYSQPELYETAFSYRNTKAEVKFLRDAYKKHAQNAAQKPLKHLLDLGCGPATHALGLAAATEVHVVGMDLSSEMLKYAQSKVAGASHLKGSVTLIQGDLTSFTPPAIHQQHATGSQPSKGFGSSQRSTTTTSSSPSASGEGSYDMVTCLLGTFTHVLRNKDAAAAFKCVAKALRPGGLFLLELAHPGDLFDGTLIIGEGCKEMWEVPMGGDQKMMVEWGAEFDNFDPVTQILHRTVSIYVFKGEEVVQSLEEVVPARQYTVQEVELLATAAGLEVVALYGDMEKDVGLAHEEAYRMVVAMVKP